jgi:hypothetical protein
MVNARSAYAVHEGLTRPFEGGPNSLEVDHLTVHDGDKLRLVSGFVENSCALDVEVKGDQARLHAHAVLHLQGKPELTSDEFLGPEPR